MTARGDLRLVVIPALAVALASCTPPAEETVPMPVGVPEAFSASGETPLPDRWWESFDDPVLHSLVERGLAGNLTLRAVWDRLAQAEAVLRREGAPLLPTVDGSAGWERELRNTDTPLGDRRDRTTDWSLGLAADYEIDLWGRIRSERDAAELDRRATAEEVRGAAITLSATVAETWYRLVEESGQIELLDRQIDTNEQVLELVTLRFRRGLAGAADVLRQRQLIESLRGERERVESAATILEHRLAILLGGPPAEPVAERRTDWVELPPLPATGIPAERIWLRPDVRQAYYELLAADRRVAAAIADRFPRVTLGGTASTSEEKLHDLFDNWIASIAAGVVAPLFDAGARRAETERARAVVSERLNTYGQEILDALAEVEDALVRERRRRALIASLDRQLDLSREATARIQDQYGGGATDYLDVLDALLRQQNLERTRRTAERESIEDRIALCRALAGGWTMERPEPRQLRPETREETEDDGS